MSEHKEPIPSMIYNASVGGHVTNSQQIIDESENKEQSQINAEVKEILGQGGSVDARINQAKNDIIGGASSNGNTLKKVEDRVSPLESAVGTGGSVDSRIASAVAIETSRAQTAEEQLRTLYNNLQQSQPIPVTSLPATGEAGKIYRLAGSTSYADYMYNENDLTTPIKMAEYDNAIDDEIKASDNLIKNRGIYNKFSIFNIEGKGILINGNEQAGETVNCTGFIDVDTIEYIKGIFFDNTHVSGVWVAGCFYDENKKFISYIDKTGYPVYNSNDFFPIINLQKANFPSSAKYVRLNSFELEYNFMYADCGRIYSYIDHSVENSKNEVKYLLASGNNQLISKTVTLKPNEITFILSHDECQTLGFLKGKVCFRIRSISRDIPYIDYSYTDKNGNIVDKNTSYSNISNLKSDFTYTLFDEDGAELYYLFFNGVAHSISDNITLDIDIIVCHSIYPSSTIAENKFFIPEFFLGLTDREGRLYPRNLIDVDDRDHSVNLMVKQTRSAEDFVRLVHNDTYYNPTSLPLSFCKDGVRSELGNIGLRFHSPSAPSEDKFILTIGDSLFYGANMAYHGCVNNELSRLFNGIGKAIANGAEPLGYNNVHIIGTMESGTEDAPIKYEGRGGWSCHTYLTTASDNAFWNPNSNKFDIDYYLSNNGFYNQGVAADGSNLIIPIMLNWNSNPEDDSYIDDYEELIDSIITSLPQTKILLIGCNCPPLQAYQWAPAYGNNSQSLEKKRAITYEQKLSKLADKKSRCYHVPILPYFSWRDGYDINTTMPYSLRNPSNLVSVFVDSHHPNLLGYGQIADILLNFITYFGW